MEQVPSFSCRNFNNLLSQSCTRAHKLARTHASHNKEFAVGGLSQQRLAQFSQIPLSCAITSANFTNRCPQRPKPVNLRRCPLIAAVIWYPLSLFFAGSQQSQDQTGRRSGGAADKHNENGVRPRRRHLHAQTHPSFFSFFFLFSFFFWKLFTSWSGGFTEGQN